MGACAGTGHGSLMYVRGSACGCVKPVHITLPQPCRIGTQMYESQCWQPGTEKRYATRRVRGNVSLYPMRIVWSLPIIVASEILSVEMYTQNRYNQFMIKNFSDSETEKIYHQEFSRKLPQTIQRMALRKLMMIDAAEMLEDLRIPPANHLEALQGDRKGQYSIRINRQYRICFIWTGKDASHVEIVDYH